MIKERAKSLAAMARVQFSTLVMRSPDGELEPVYIALVSPEFLDMFQAEIILGRGFRSDDKPWSNGPVALLTESYWHSHFGGATDVVGRRLGIADLKYPWLTTVGVLGRGFRGFGFFTNRKVDLVLALPIQEKERKGRNQMPVTAIGALAPGATLERARQEVAAIASGLVRSGLVKPSVVLELIPASQLFRSVRQRLAFAAIVAVWRSCWCWFVQRESSRSEPWSVLTKSLSGKRSVHRDCGF
jgi:hypothetical protein